MKIKEFVIDDFNRQIDNLQDLIYELFLKNHGSSVLEIYNRLEITKRVFNHYAATGKVEIPE